MLHLLSGDILQANAEALVNTVNCVGVMGRGIALQFRKAFPENFKVYETACSRKEVRPGRMLTFDTGLLTRPRYVINFPTKRHWRGKSRIEDIDSGLEALVREVRERGIASIAVPPLGCGLGGLDWSDVRPRIMKAFEGLPDVEVFVFGPSGAPAPEEMIKRGDIPSMTPGRAALIELMVRYREAVLDPFVSLLEIHKLMYLMQEAGEPLRLKFEKGVYGLYAKNLRHVLNELEGHFLTGYGDAADKPELPIELLANARDAAGKLLAGHPETRARFDRVASLIHGFETAHGMELLSTVHWVATREGACGPEEAIAKTHAWNQRKRIFDDRQVRLAWRVLEEQGWLEPCGGRHLAIPSRY